MRRRRNADTTALKGRCELRDSTADGYRQYEVSHRYYRRNRIHRRLSADDLMPTVTWANLPHTSVDTWELLGYHILSGREVINLQIAGGQTAITLPTGAGIANVVS